ncbi:HAD-IA family hydrolase [Wenzhouxiangella sp. XN79A]|uniref:HAD family hydrolase n=1 Tax=Wenzhouxiangella sp. XN79A TaxID=2724193 RepID=UPI00144A69BF|nr:HAD-IA family hydrolase [Wenzhouxiangella sp. XN79A]NKI36020.1 HAD-IA family hydrolase [Wenzhouxiangella sp. XN79A]
MTGSALRAVLFDLDGTLADTAPDLVGAVARLRARLGLAEIDLGHLPPLAGQGALALMAAGVPELDEAQREVWRSAYLEDYRAHCWDDSRPFDGVPDLLERLDAMGLKIGVVTNKLRALAEPLIRRAGWADRVAALVGGDDTDRPKPAPDPVEQACRLLGVAPGEAVMVGDDRRDIQAGRAAGSRTVAAAWGYLAASEDPAGWGADALIRRPIDLLAALAEIQTGTLR